MLDERLRQGSQPTDGATVVDSADGEFVEFSSRDQAPTRSGRSCRSSAPAAPKQARHDARPAAQRDPEARPHDGQLDHWEADFNKALLRRDVQRRRRVVQELLHAAVRGPLHASTSPPRTGSTCRATRRRTATTRSRTTAARGPSSTTRSTPGTPRRSRPARRPPRSTPTCRSSTSGTATTSTTTATSTSPTATSTTSRPCTPARARRPAPTARRHLVAPLVRRPTTTAPTARSVGGEATSAAARGSVTPNYFIGDYTVEPENGGLGVFAHEYGHDLGLPDFYDTNGGENGTVVLDPDVERLVARATESSRPGDEGIGTQPGTGPGGEALPRLAQVHRGRQGAGSTESITLGPSQSRSTAPTRPSRSTCPTLSTTRPRSTIPAGDHAWWSGRGDDLTATPDAVTSRRRRP